MSLFEEVNFCEIIHPDYPGEHLVCCRNPLLTTEGTRKPEALLTSTEAELKEVATTCERPRRPLRGKDAIALRAGRVNRHKMAKHFVIEINEDAFSFSRSEARIVDASRTHSPLGGIVRFGSASPFMPGLTARRSAAHGVPIGYASA